MFDPITIVIAIVGAAATIWGATEAWRQRRLAERSSSGPVIPAAQLGSPTLHSAAIRQAQAIDAIEKRVWRCGIYEYPPLSSWPNGPSANPIGPLVELALQITNSLGKSAVFEPFSYKDFYAGDDRIPDMVVGMFNTERRSAHVAFSRRIYKIGLHGICRRDQKEDVLKSLREGDLRVAVYFGEVGWEFVQDEIPDALRQQRVATLLDGRQMDTMDHLKQGEYQVVIMDSVACHNFLREGDHSQQFRLAFEEPLDKFDVCIAVRLESRHLLPQINEGIERIRNSREFLRMEELALAGYEKIIEPRAMRAEFPNR